MAGDASGGRPNKPQSGPELEMNSGVYAMWKRPPAGRVLVVEPDADLARILEARLARDGHEVILAETGQAGLEAAHSQDVDVALIDRNLWDIHGLEVMQEMKIRAEPFEAIVMTADPTVDIFVEALELGAFDLLVKPFSRLELVSAKVMNAVGKVRAERDRNELARLLHAQTRDLANREAGAELAIPEEGLPSSIDLDGMSGVDPLTGLPNRRAAADRFRKETARALRYDRPLCIAMASIDNLEAVIESHGAEVGDGVLRGVVAMFTSMVRDVDFVARRQAGEFFFLFPETTRDNGAIVVDRIRQRLVQTAFSDTLGEEAAGTQFNLSVSFGLAGLPTDTMNADILWDAAEAALARARASGNRVVLFEAGMLKRV